MDLYQERAEQLFKDLQQDMGPRFFRNDSKAKQIIEDAFRDLVRHIDSIGAHEPWKLAPPDDAQEYFS